jgi:hypothetical protein
LPCNRKRTDGRGVPGRPSSSVSSGRFAGAMPPELEAVPPMPPELEAVLEKFGSAAAADSTTIGSKPGGSTKAGGGAGAGAGPAAAPPGAGTVSSRIAFKRRTQAVLWSNFFGPKKHPGQPFVGAQFAGGLLMCTG